MLVYTWHTCTYIFSISENVEKSEKTEHIQTKQKTEKVKTKSVFQNPKYSITSVFLISRVFSPFLGRYRNISN